jgi:signal peptide peptidase SppA
MHQTMQNMQRDPQQAATAGQAAATLFGMLGSGPLLIEPGYLSAAMSALDAGEMSWFTGRWDPQNRLNVTDDGIAIVRVHGMLLARGAWLGSIWGMTSYEGLGEQFKRLTNDPSIKQVILDIDSGGGMAAGIWDLMPSLDALKDKKPVHAIANPFCASAAYAIGCAATSFTVNRGATTGSIGVVRPHMDMSAALEKWGMKPTLFVAGRMKAAGNPYEPLTPEVRSYIQTGVDRTYGEFVAHVAKYRGMSEDAVRNTEARVYDASDAVDLGLADGVMSFEELLDHVRSSPKSVARSRANTPTGGKSMTTASGASLSQGDLDRITAAIAPMLPASAGASNVQPSATVSRADAEKMASDAAVAAVKADRERTATILALPEAKGHEARALKLAHDTAMTTDQVKDFLSDLPKADAGTSGFPHPLIKAMQSPGSSAGVKPDGALAADGTAPSATASMPPLGDVMAAMSPKRAKRS